MIPLLLSPLEMVYASAVRARNARFDRTPPQRLGWPVISVGNLSVGGAGKTPLVIALAQLLRSQGWLPDVLSRGYGRADRLPARVAADGSAGQFGDEPLLIARTTGVPVYVSRSRYEAGRMAEQAAAGFAQRVHLLDDGFQHRQLFRDADVLVFHRSDLQQRLLPAGRLREPLSSLRRADVIVLRVEDADLEPALRSYAKAGCLFWRMRRTLALPQTVLRGLAFCAIARPLEFFAGLEAAGAPIVERVRFRDHHRYTQKDVERLAQSGARAGCDAFLVTAKDEVKLEAGLRQRLEEVAPVLTVSLTAVIEDEVGAMAALSSLLT